MPEITHTSYPHAPDTFGSGGQRSLNKGFQMEETLYHAKLLLFSRKQTMTMEKQPFEDVSLNKKW